MSAQALVKSLRECTPSYVRFDVEHVSTAKTWMMPCLDPLFFAWLILKWSFVDRVPIHADVLRSFNQHVAVTESKRTWHVRCIKPNDKKQQLTMNMARTEFQVPFSDPQWYVKSRATKVIMWLVWLDDLHGFPVVVWQLLGHLPWAEGKHQGADLSSIPMNHTIQELPAPSKCGSRSSKLIWSLYIQYSNTF